MNFLDALNVYQKNQFIKNRRNAIDRTKELVKNITNKYPLYTNTIV